MFAPAYSSKTRTFSLLSASLYTVEHVPRKDTEKYKISFDLYVWTGSKVCRQVQHYYAGTPVKRNRLYFLRKRGKCCKVPLRHFRWVARPDDAQRPLPNAALQFGHRRGRRSARQSSCAVRRPRSTENRLRGITA